MSRPALVFTLVLPLAAAPTLTPAQSPPAVSAPQAAAAGLPQHPADAAAPVPKVVHRSALAGYRRHTEPETKAWRQANDEVARIGGWRAYLREAAETTPAAPAAPPAAAASGVRR